MVSGSIKQHPAVLGLFASRLPGLQKRDGAFWAKCIFHPEKTPSLNVAKDKNGDWAYHCFGCSVGGDILHFLQAADKITFSKAIKILEEATGGDWEETKKKSDEVFKRLDISELKPSVKYTLEEYAKYEIALYESSEAKEWLFTQRGITWETARKLHFGFTKSLDTFTKKHYENLESIKNSGWIITPAIEAQEVISIEARSIARKEFIRKPGMEYQVLYGIDLISPEEPLFVTEGKFDQAVFVQAGYRAVSLPNAVKNLTPRMRDLLMSAPVRFLAGDNDGAVGTASMTKLWSELKERTYRIVWPKGMKDANQTFIEYCERDIDKFKTLVDDLMIKAYSNPLPGIQGIQDILERDESESVENREDRFIFSIDRLDKMSIIVPGNVVYISASCTGTGKSTFSIQETLKSAIKYNNTVLNYQTQLQGQEVGNIVTAQLLAKDRNEIGPEDRKEASRRLRGVEYYIGHDPTKNTANEVLDLIESGIRRVGANIVVLDLIHDIFGQEKELTRSQERAMRRIKTMAQQYLCIFFLIGQPRKVDPKNQGKAISIYDSKGSECIPSESDVVMYFHREPVKNMTDETSDKLSPEVEVHCMKARWKGKGGAYAKIMFLGKIATFRDLVNLEPKVDNRFDF